MTAAAWCRLVSALLPLLAAARAVTPATDQTQKSGGNLSAILDHLQRGYDKRLRPNYGGVPVTVGITMHLTSISSVSEVMMDFTSDFFFRQFWQDPRLAFEAQDGLVTLNIGSEYLKNLWVPDTYFPNEKTSYYHLATTSNEFLRIKPAGDILRSIRLTITASCPMNLMFFPMDRQLCELQIESFGYTTTEIGYIWKDGAHSVKVESGVSLAQFKIIGHRQRTILFQTSTGNYSRLALEIQFERSMGYYLIQMYVPSSLIVIISWVSFWLNRNATPARVSLGVTTVLTMTTLMSSTNAALPKISYIKAIDVYMGTCFVMVFASLLEYAYVGYIAKRIGMRRTRLMAIQKMAIEKMQRDVRDHTAMVMADEHTSKSAMSTLRRGHSGHGAHHGGHGTHSYQCGPQPCADHREAHTCEVRFKVHDPKAHSKGCILENTINGGRHDEESANMASLLKSKKVNKLLGCSPSDVDKYSRIVFPVTFICFNLMYWIIYLHVSDKVAEGLVPFVKK
ncbi:gamma-aminobutyric acid receptor subunit beta-like isoform X2 [Amphibalanus amphitrite]|uniref:gamma-aminobutyric acid receptor subunit beta-like isoform X2 n=1 Tax=Amphibalanus amphitrite TaxID=1232801 RepID=UPI001C928B7D|nr:gamma-aminobutyric acid receptor subunit beta-like isoform X2 [Amphibalanus amphitrite]